MQHFRNDNNRIFNCKQKKQRQNIKNVNGAILANTPIIKLIFSVKTRNIVEQLFQAANITHRSIYPDENGLAKSIKYW